MLRKIISAVLTVSFIGVSSSGLLMLLSHSFLFQFKLHPVHNIFGPLMLISGLIHLILNFNILKQYYKRISITAISIILIIMLSLLYYTGFNRSFDPKFVEIISTFDDNINSLKNNLKE